LSKKYFLITGILFIICCCAKSSFSQEIKINAENTSLQEVFFALQKDYGIQFSYNDKLIENCFINITNTFSSADEAIHHIIFDCNLAFEKVGDVYIILNKPEIEILKPEKSPVYFLFSGRVSDKVTGEALPLSTIQYGGKLIVTDVNGVFSIKHLKSSSKIKVSYVGYFQVETVLYSNKNINIQLTPSEVNLQEVVIQSKDDIFDMHVGQTAGTLRLNHNISSFLPGSQNNSIYNLLRLQAGVMAAGEQTNDYVIWGSYKGHNLILFDNITLFSIGNSKDNISPVNSLIVKDIEIKKGGYNSSFYNRVGGVVNIFGKNGNYNKFGGDFNINNQSVSGKINIPSFLRKNLLCKLVSGNPFTSYSNGKVRWVLPPMAPLLYQIIVFRTLT